MVQQLPDLNLETLSRWDKFRYNVYDVIDNEETSNWASQLVDSIIMILILLSLGSTVAESFQSIHDEYWYYFDIFENVTLVIFSLEYLLRVWTADFKYRKESSKGKARWKFITSGTGIVDILAIFPLLVQVLIPNLIKIKLDLRFIRILKVTRMLRVLKLSSFTSSVIVVGNVFYEKRSELGMTLFTTFVVMLVASTVMYYIEHDHPYNLENGKFSNIISTMWWAVATLTTVGYGDIYPVTAWGQFAGSIIAILGLGVVALPTGIIGAAFIEKIEKQQEEARIARESAMLDNKLAAQEHDIIETIQEHLHPAEPIAIPAPPPVRTGTGSHDFCMSKFGSEFVYCPYCGQPLKDHKHSH